MYEEKKKAIACGALTFSGENAIEGWEIPEDRATGPLASYHCIKM